MGPGAGIGTILNSTSGPRERERRQRDLGFAGNSGGGLVGNNPGTITDSFASGTVGGGAFFFVGGLVGVNGPTGVINGSFGTTIKDVFSGASGNVNVSDATGPEPADLWDSTSGRSAISIATGNVTGGNSSDIIKAGHIGGLVGLQDSGGSINTAFATGNVTAG